MNKITCLSFAKKILLLITLATAAHSAMAAKSPPSQPLSVAASVINGVTTISWQPPASNGGANITRYIAFSADGASCSSRGARAKKCRIKKLSSDVRSFRVVAVNNYGRSEPSAESNPTIASKQDVPASCGTSNGISASVAPSALPDLCLVGLSSSVVGNGDGSFSWKCVGYGAGDTLNCNTIPVPSAGSGGGAGGGAGPGTNPSIPRDMNAGERQYQLDLLLKTIPTYLKAPSTFVLISGPNWTWYNSIGKPDEGAWTLSFDAKNLFGVPLRYEAICPTKYMTTWGGWTFQMTPDLRLCFFYD